jgi:serine/threonine-protein kinase RsbW
MKTTCDNVQGPEAAPEYLGVLGFEGIFRKVSLRRAEEMAPLLEGVVAPLADLGYAAGDCLGVRLALEEAVVNGLRHGNAGDPTKQVIIRYVVNPKAIVVEVEDEGPGFNLAAVPDPTTPESLHKPSGRGLLLMRHYMTWVRFSGRGNRVTLCKRRSE